MEKTIKGKLFTFKDSFMMKDWAALKEAQKRFVVNNNEFELVFDLFPIVCLSIDNKRLSVEEMKAYVEKCDDIEEFTEITEVVADIYKGLVDNQKKKSEKTVGGTQ